MASSSSSTLVEARLKGITHTIYSAAKDKNIAKLQIELKRSFEQNSIDEDLFKVFLKLRRENDTDTKSFLLQHVAEIAFQLGPIEGFKFFGPLTLQKAPSLVDRGAMIKAAQSFNFNSDDIEYFIIIRTWSALIAKHKPEQFGDFLCNLLGYFAWNLKSFPVAALHDAYYYLGLAGQLETIQTMAALRHLMNTFDFDFVMGCFVRGLVRAGHKEEVNKFLSKIKPSGIVLSHLALEYLEERPEEALKILKLILRDTECPETQINLLLQIFTRIDESLFFEFVKELKPFVPQTASTFLGYRPYYDLDQIVKEARIVKEFMSIGNYPFKTAEMILSQGCAISYLLDGGFKKDIPSEKIPRLIELLINYYGPEIFYTKREEVLTELRELKFDIFFEKETAPPLPSGPEEKKVGLFEKSARTRASEIFYKGVPTGRFAPGKLS